MLKNQIKGIISQMKAKLASCQEREMDANFKLRSLNWIKGMKEFFCFAYFNTA